MSEQQTETSDGTRKREPSEAQRLQQQWVGTLCEVTGWSVATMAARAGKLAKALKLAGGTPDDLLAHYGQVDAGAAWWWYRDDWRGQRGQRPGEAGIRETWGFWNKPVVVQLPQARSYDALDAFVEASRGKS